MEVSGTNRAPFANTAKDTSHLRFFPFILLRFILFFHGFSGARVTAPWPFRDLSICRRVGVKPFGAYREEKLRVFVLVSIASLEIYRLYKVSVILYSVNDIDLFHICLKITKYLRKFRNNFNLMIF